jgi:hypothetical protein
MLAATIFLIYAKSLIIFAMDIELSYYIYYSSHFFAAATCFIYLRRLQIAHYICLKIIGLVIGLCIFLTFCSSFVFDTSWDGMAYHQEAILQLDTGWNPVYYSLPANVENSIWIEHYPKMTWIFSYVILKTYNSIEAGKVLHFYLHISLFFVLLFSLNYNKSSLDWRTILYSLAVVLNPVSINQFFTFYNDSEIYTIGLLAMLLGWHSIVLHNSFHKYIYFSLIILLVNIKFTGVIYSIIIIISLHAVNYSINKSLGSWVIFAMSILSVFIGLFVAGFSPYYKNFILYKNIFYPLMGEGAIDIITRVTPPEVFGMGRVASFIESNFYFPNIMNVTNYDSRLGGFGFMFPLLLIASLLLCLYILVCDRRIFAKLTLCLLGLAAFVFVNPAPWMARYVPFAWLIPLVVIYYALKCNNKYIHVWANLILKLQLLSVIVMVLQTLYFNIIATKSIYLQLDNFKKSQNIIEIDFGPFQSLRYRLDHYQIGYVHQRLSNEDSGKGIQCIANTWCESKFLMP